MWLFSRKLDYWSRVVSYGVVCQIFDNISFSQLEYPINQRSIIPRLGVSGLAIYKLVIGKSDYR